MVALDHVVLDRAEFSTTRTRLRQASEQVEEYSSQLKSSQVTEW